MDFLRFLYSKRFLKHLTGNDLDCVCAGLADAFRAKDLYTAWQLLYCPDYTGQNIDDIIAKQPSVFNFVVIDSVFDLDNPKGTVLHQDPYPDSKVKENRKIYLTIVSSTPEKTSMPDLRFLTLRQAINTLESCGLKTGKIFYIPTFDADAVQQQRYNGKIILAGTRLDKGSVVELTVGIGAKGQTEIKDTVTRQDSVQ
jgi:beta-lactam-binding protein with PASTA domain